MLSQKRSEQRLLKQLKRERKRANKNGENK